MALDLSSIVDVRADIAPQGLLQREFGRTLFLVRHDVTRPFERLRVYSNFDQVGADYGPEDAAYQAALIYFQQQPFPRNLLIGTWLNAAVDSRIVGTAPATVAEIQAFGTVTVSFNGEDMSLALGTPTYYDEIATTLQTAIRALTFDGADDIEVEYDPTRGAFVVTIPLQDNAPVPIAASLFTSTGNAAVALGLSVEAGAQHTEGHGSETILEALNALGQDDWYFIAVENALVDTYQVTTLAAWVATQPRMLALDTAQAEVLTTGDTTSYAAQLAALDYDRTFMVWSATQDYKALSLAARFSSVNFAAPKGLITGMFKKLRGTRLDLLTPTQKAELNRKQVNYYSPFGGDSILTEGWTLSAGAWIDVRYLLDWLVNATQVAVYNLFLQTPWRVSQTEAGLATIQAVVQNVCEQGVLNGGIAPGQVSEALAAEIRQVTGNMSFDGFLSAGYLVHIGSVAAQPQADREARKSPPVRVWLKGPGAVQRVDVRLTFTN